MTVRLVLLAWMACSCSAHPPATSHPATENAGASDWGNIWEMKVLAGTYDGYVVIAPCNMCGRLVGVRGGLTRDAMGTFVRRLEAGESRHNATGT